jgi:hypothetical protein
MPEFKGSCLCGKVNYAGSADPLFTGLCHCTNCQKATGSAFAGVIGIPAPSIRVTGTTTRYDGVGDSGKATHRDFCPVCGTTVTQSADVMAGITMVPIGTLADTSWVKPGSQIYCDRAIDWALLPELPRFAKMPG